jgi:hypothetical protein
MAIPLLHTVVSWLLKKRVHDIELFIKYPNEVQRDELTNLLQTAKKTEVGKQYGFADIHQYEDFANRVPVRTYEEIAPMIERCTARGAKYILAYTYQMVRQIERNDQCQKQVYSYLK